MLQARIEAVTNLPHVLQRQAAVDCFMAAPPCMRVEAGAMCAVQALEVLELRDQLQEQQAEAAERQVELQGARELAAQLEARQLELEEQLAEANR